MRKKIKEFIIKNIAGFQWGREKIWNFGKDYIAGSSLEEGIDTVGRYFRRGRYSTLDILGESARTQEETDGYQHYYLKATEMVSERFGDTNACTISVKGSAICCIGETGDDIPSEEYLEKRLEEIIKRAKSKGIHVTLDMEDHRWTDVSLNVSKRLWNKGYDRLQVGIVLQANLNRTEKDIDDILSNYPEDRIKGIRVRACKGIYIESRQISTRSKRKIKTRLIERIQQLFRGGFYVEIASHDHKVIHHVIDYIERNHINNDRFEFQFLKGVQKGYDIEGTLKDKGYKVRYYMPVEMKKYEGVSYMMRRCIENPRIIIVFIKNKYDQYSTGKS